MHYVCSKNRNPQLSETEWEIETQQNRLRQIGRPALWSNNLLQHIHNNRPNKRSSTKNGNNYTKKDTCNFFCSLCNINCSERLNVKLCELNVNRTIGIALFLTQIQHKWSWIVKIWQRTIGSEMIFCVFMFDILTSKLFSQ